METLNKLCAACGDILTPNSDHCPSCQTTVDSDSITEAQSPLDDSTNGAAQTTNEAKSSNAGNATGSTLIEFPGVASLPQWRKDLSERVREIQKKRALEAAAEASNSGAPIQTTITAQTTPLGLVQPVEPPPLNPIVEKALKRLERARQAQAPPAMSPRVVRGSRASAATAQAFVAEPEILPQIEIPEASPKPAPKLVPVAAPCPQEPDVVADSAPIIEELDNADSRNEPIESLEAERFEAENPILKEVVVRDIAPVETIAAVETETFVAFESKSLASELAPEVGREFAPSIAPVAPTFPAPVETVNAAVAEIKPAIEVAPKPVPRRVCAEVIDDAYLARREAEKLAQREAARKDDRAPFFARVAASVFDWLLLFALSAGIIFLIHPSPSVLTDVRALAMLGAIPIGLAVVYSSFALTLAGCTFGMRIFRLRVVNSRDGFTPTFGRSLLRSVGYLFSLAICGFGIFYALIDAERRGFHDCIAGTTVVRG